jgi:hypothetical protein
MEASLFELEKAQIWVKAKKIDDKEYFSLTKSKFAPLFEDYSFLFVLDRHIYEKYNFTLPKIYTALYTRYGLHNGYDDYKCSFSYRFRLTVYKAPDHIYNYLLHIMDMKGNPPYFTFYRELGEHELDKKGRYVEHIDTEFSKEAMQEFMGYFVNNLRLIFEDLKDTFKKSFFRTIPYDYSIYGFKNGKFFYECYYHESDTNDKNENDDDEEEEDDHGYSAYLDAVEKYKKNPKMKGEMSKRYD